MYAHGEGVSKDLRESARRYSKAAESGYATAQGRLGQQYEYGLGVAMDYVSAHVWYKLAALSGYEPAKKGMIELERRMTSQQREAAEASFLQRRSQPASKEAVMIEKKLPVQQWP